MDYTPNTFAKKSAKKITYSKVSSVGESAIQRVKVMRVEMNVHGVGY